MAPRTPGRPEREPNIGGVPRAEALAAFGRRLYAARIEKGYTSAEALAKAVGMSRPTIEAWERGAAMPNLKNLTALADLLDTAPTALLPGVKAPAVPPRPATDQTVQAAFERTAARVDDIGRAVAALEAAVGATPDAGLRAAVKQNQATLSQLLAEVRALRREVRVPAEPAKPAARKRSPRAT